MEPVIKEVVMTKESNILKNLNDSFGSYRAEWLNNKIFELFEEPHYFAGLQNIRPCIIEGGRGTGKTTVLKGLSYQGRYEILNKSLNKFQKDDFIGIYLKINTNHVRSFKGEELTSNRWERLFSHYFNLIVTFEILQFLKWFDIKGDSDYNVDSINFSLITRSLNISDNIGNIYDLIDKVELQLYEFQSSLNNIDENSNIRLTFIGDPIKIITEQILKLPYFEGKIFYLLIDEYENFEDYQQKIVNTLIKHTSNSFTFKIGVRELGWRVKHTLNPQESLYDPADYVLINIEEKLNEDENLFKNFAKKVCLHRISSLSESTIIDIDKFLPSLSIEEEAILLGVEKTELYGQIGKLPKEYYVIIEKLHPLYQYFISYWANIQNKTIEQEIMMYKKDKSTYDTRYGNYKYSLLFKIRKGRGSSGIQKYYCGWDTFAKMSYGNIRYLMELVHKALEKHLVGGADILEPISPQNQTVASQECGLKNLKEFEGLYKDGALLSRFLLSMGRVFQILAKSSQKTAPEKNQFTIKDFGKNEEAIDLLNAAVMHLALIRTPGNKLNKNEDTRQFLYMIHPIYSSYFQFSYRKKRKIEISSKQFLDLANNKDGAINEILGMLINDRVDDYQLPVQMDLFSNYYNG